MRSLKRRAAVLIGERESRAIAANLGRDARITRKRRRLTQARLGERVGLSQSQISRLELGAGAGASIDTWVSIGIVLDWPVAVGFSRDVADPLNDAGHLEAQELVARLAGGAGWRVTFEAPNDPRAPTGSTDLRLKRARRIALVEIWNRIDDLGAAARSSDRKLAAVPGASSIWMLADTAANRAIVGRYPTVLRARFPAGSAAWLRALETGADPPSQPGLAWIDVRGARLRPVRLRGNAR